VQHHPASQPRIRWLPRQVRPQARRHLSRLRKRLPAQDSRRQFKDLIRKALADRSAATPNEFDTSGKSPAYLHHRRILKPAPKIGRGLFFWRQGSQSLPDDLTRRANHRHIFTIARILSPRRETGLRAFSIGRQPHLTAPHPAHASSPERRKRVAVRAFVSWHARTCRQPAWPSPRSPAAG
jgi:hypothetical protein